MGQFVASTEVYFSGEEKEIKVNTMKKELEKLLDCIRIDDGKYQIIINKAEDKDVPTKPLDIDYMTGKSKIRMDNK